ncbi:MAG: hypothetical protein KIT16_02175 [Rhodospirillaceae bacterium]|nr:hypothetical protein [Rhodospirillaceae bacterium]
MPLDAVIVTGLTGRTPREAFMQAIDTWEGLFQDDPDDVANWADGKLVGTMRGVTPAALALFRGVPVGSLTKDDVKSVSLQEAADIGMSHYYRGVGFDRLPWVPATEVWVDIGWGSGPVLAVKKMQAMIGVADDGAVGPFTLRAFTEWVRDHGHDGAVKAIHAWRRGFYERIVELRPSNRKFLKGWLRRADWYLPKNKDWWPRWMS